MTAELPQDHVSFKADFNKCVFANDLYLNKLIEKENRDMYGHSDEGSLPDLKFSKVVQIPAGN